MRQLEERLVQLVEKAIKAGKIQPDWIPPTFLTLGTFPETLYPVQRKLAEPLIQLFCWRLAVSQLAKTDATKLTRLFPHFPLDKSLPFQMDLMKLLATVHRELAAEGIDFTQVVQECRRLGLVEEIPRWETLSDLQKLYLETCDRYHLWDVQTARMVAVQKQECRTEKRIILIGTVDLNAIQKQLLSQVSDRVTAFVFAPEEKRNGFDPFGCLIPEVWEEQEVTIPDDQIYQADTPSDQARLAIEQLKRFAAQKVPRSDCTIGAPDSDVIPFLRQLLLSEEVEVHDSAGSPMSQNRIYRLLTLTAGYLEQRTFDAFLELIRHPDLEEYLLRHWYPDPASEVSVTGTLFDSPVTSSDVFSNSPKMTETLDEPANIPLPGDWISEIQWYQNLFLPDRIDGQWHVYVNPETPQRNTDFPLLRRVYTIVEDLLLPFRPEEESPIQKLPIEKTDLPSENLFQPDSGSPHSANFPQNPISERESAKTEMSETGSPERIGEILEQSSLFKWIIREKRLRISDWCWQVSQFLCRIYPDGNRSPDEIIARQTDAGIEVINNILNQLYLIPHSLFRPVSGSEMLRFLLQEADKSRIPASTSSNAFELLGWLDLVHDTAHHLVLTGMNEGVVPSVLSNDPFLPNTLRSRLHLEDNRKRYARDAYLLSAILASRPETTIIFGRHSLQGDPLLPSRFFFATDPKTITNRVCRFFATDSGTPSVSSVDRVQERSQFNVPVLHMTGEPPTSVNVTEFRDFLTCPYRYFLGHQLHLRKITENVELDAAGFGNLVHSVLREFAETKIKDCEDPVLLASWLSRCLDKMCRERFGDNVLPMVRVQLEQARRRLQAFAFWQAQWRSQGNQIKFVEGTPQNGSVSFPVDGQSMRICGRIDRIDFNPETGQWFIFDYKTYDTYKEGKRLKGDNNPENPLLTIRIKNTVEEKHRRPVFPPQTAATPPKHPDAPSPSQESKQPGPFFQWHDLQLPLYRHFFRQILQENHLELPDAPPILGYIILPRNNKTKALGAPWQESDLKMADEEAQWVIRTLRRLWREPIDPNALIDPNNPNRGTVLAVKPPPFTENFAAITMENL